MMKSYLCRSTLTLATLGLVACGNGPAIEIASVHVKSELIAAKAGGTIQITAADDARLAGTRIQIPADALARDTIITIDGNAADLVDADTEAAGPTVEFGPDGTQFAIAARVTLPYEGAADEDLFRVFVTESDGTTRVLLPEELTFDAEAHTLTFAAAHFTRYQSGRARQPCAHVRCPANSCHRGRCSMPSPCSDPNACGPAPGIATWTCEDGSVGGFTGQCLATPQGCGWSINNCPRQCSAQECGPAPGAPNFTCPDGMTIGGPTPCHRRMDGSCGYDFIQCPPNACTADSDCPMGAQCQNGQCVRNNPTACQNDQQCAPDQSCINGQCTSTMTPPPVCMADSDCPMGAVCRSGQCVGTNPTGCMSDAECAPGQACIMGQCGGTPPPPMCMSDRDCPMGAACRNGQCSSTPPPPPACMTDADCPMGACINGQCSSTPPPPVCMADSDCPMGAICRQGQCVRSTPTGCMADSDCAPGQACNNGVCGGSNACSAPNACGPQPGIATWICQDGSVGGFTGRCEPNPNGACGWVIVNCPRMCSAMECGPAPGQPNYLCPDGMTVGGPAPCQRAADGSCGYPIVQCPGTGCQVDSDCSPSQQCANGVCQ